MYALLPPFAVKNLDPTWKNCVHAGDPDGDGYIDYDDPPWTWDPPHPLSPKPALAIPTTSWQIDPPSPPATPIFPSRTSMFNPATKSTFGMPTQTPSKPGGDPGASLDPPFDPGTGGDGGNVGDGNGNSGNGGNGGNVGNNNGPNPGDPSNPGDPANPIIHPAADGSATFTIGTFTFTASSGGLALPSITIVPGGPAATISGQVISLATDGVVVNGQFTPFTVVDDPANPTLDPLGDAIMHLFTDKVDGAGVNGERTATGSDPQVSGTGNGIVTGGASREVQGVKLLWRVWFLCWGLFKAS